MTRVYTKKGDVFEVKIDEHTKKYLQLIEYDLTQLNSDVIRVFKPIYAIDARPSLEEIVQQDIEFYAHTTTKVGVKLGLWQKVGNHKDVGNLKKPLFRDTNDCCLPPGRERIKVSCNWYIWQINDEIFTQVGELKGEHRNAEIGWIFSPERIMNRLLTGNYNIVYPDFE